MPLTVKKNADFKGLLLQRRRRPGQRYVLLLFRTDMGLRFCLSRDLKKVQSMQIGQQYRVRGVEETTRHNTYLRLQSAVLIRSKSAVVKKRIGLIASVASFIVITGTASAGYFLQQNAVTSSDLEQVDVQVQDKKEVQTPSTTGKIKKLIDQTVNSTTKQTGGTSSQTQNTNRNSTNGATEHEEPDVKVNAPIIGQPAPSPAPTPAPTPVPEPQPEKPTDQPADQQSMAPSGAAASAQAAS